MTAGPRGRVAVATARAGARGRGQRSAKSSPKSARTSFITHCKEGDEPEGLLEKPRGVGVQADTMEVDLFLTSPRNGCWIHSVPWERRRDAARLLAALKDPHREWDAVVVGEGTRCWLGNQFSLIAPRFAAYGVDLWVPELGGKFDARNPSHKMLTSVLGGMSESERQQVCYSVVGHIRCAAEQRGVTRSRAGARRPRCQGGMTCVIASWVSPVSRCR